jgi:Cu+-exporting ATPase
MGGANIIVLVLSVLAIAGLGWYFFAPRKAHLAELGDGIQKIAVTVKGGYSPDLIHVRQGVPLEIEFDRQESGECTNRVVFADLGLNAGLPAYTKTTVRLRPERAGTFGFACGMNMIHGTLVVDPADHTNGTAAAEPTTAHVDAHHLGATAAEAEAAEMAERRAEIADLSRRVIIGDLDCAGAVRGDGPRALPRRLGTGVAAQPLGAAGVDHAGDVPHRLADPPDRLAGSGPPIRGDEFADHSRHNRRLRL